MTGCLMITGMMMTLASAGFSLEWTHSVERISWREDWKIRADGLLLIRAAVKGSGAGMEPGPGAQLQDGWWVWSPDLPVQPELLLAASGATPSPWHLCDGVRCVDLGGQPGAPVSLRPCPPDVTERAPIDLN